MKCISDGTKLNDGYVSEFVYLKVFTASTKNYSVYVDSSSTSSNKSNINQLLFLPEQF